MRKMDADCLDSSDRAFKLMLGKVASDQQRKYLQLHRQYRRYMLTNYIEYQRRKGTLHYLP